MNFTKILAVVCVAAFAAMSCSIVSQSTDYTKGLPEYTIDGETDLDGNFYISFVYSKNIIMLDGKGNVVWSKHEDPDGSGIPAGFWDFKKHVVNGTTYYSYHDQNTSGDKYGLEGFAPGERVIMNSNFSVIKRITFEESSTVEKGHFIDGHDFLLIDLDHYIISGYIKDRVYNIPGYPEGSDVIYSYLQEVKNGKVVWEWRSIDYPEIYDMVQTDANPDARDFANVKGAPDYIHFNAMRLNDNGDLVCSFRHLDTVLCLDRTKSTDQIKWKLSGNEDMFGLSDDQKTSGQHYVRVDGDTVTVFDNHNSEEKTRIRSYRIDTENKVLKEFNEYRVEGKFSSACGSQQHLYDDVWMIGWGRSENDNMCMCVYDFATDKVLISMTLANGNNFTYRCVYYE